MLEGIVSLAIVTAACVALYRFADWLGEVNRIREIGRDEPVATGGDECKFCCCGDAPHRVELTTPDDDGIERRVGIAPAVRWIDDEVEQLDRR